MAGIDKTYVSNAKDFAEIYNWMKNFEKVLPNGCVIYGANYLYYDDEGYAETIEWFKENKGKEIPIMNTTTVIDYFLIKECPNKVVQNRMKEVYDEEWYDAVKNGTSEYDVFEYPEFGKHVRLVKGQMASRKTPKADRYFVEVEMPDQDFYSGYYEDLDRWSVPGELICGNRSSAYVGNEKSIKALIRKIRNWKLPIGARVKVMWMGHYGCECEFEITR